VIRLALAQVNPTVGDLAGNAALLARDARRAADAGADLAVFPEMALTGYPPEDLLLRPAFLSAAEKTLRALARALPRDLAVVIGAPTIDGRRLRNSAVLVRNGKIHARFHKWFLPNYGVFDEERYFEPGDVPVVFDLGDTRVGLTVCEDLWRPAGPALAAARAGASLIVNLSASPYHELKVRERNTVIKKKVAETGAAVAYCNAVGGQDELVYDGGSRVLDARGRTIARAPQFDECLLLADLDAPARARRGTAAAKFPARRTERPPLPPHHAPPLDRDEEAYSALVLATRDYAAKNGFKKAVIGLSGGIDSALVAVVAVDALGKDNVVGVTLPTRFNAAETKADAAALAHNLGVAFHTIPIEGVVQSFLKALAPLFAGRPADTTEENLQSRVRGTTLMALSNKFGWLVLTTGNKSEVSVGYFTLYGDSAGGFAVIKDIPKTRVYALARWRNARAGRPPIPESVFTRPPTAELRENQTDQDSLPPYDVLDKIVHAYVEDNRGPDDIVRGGVPRAVVAKTLRLIDGMEYKRRQAPPGVKITPRAFGRDRRMPITNKFKADA
jgi:NAD+ synthase (glutamine-hydrolysing)